MPIMRPSNACLVLLLVIFGTNRMISLLGACAFRVGTGLSRATQSKPSGLARHSTSRSSSSSLSPSIMLGKKNDDSPSMENSSLRLSTLGLLSKVINRATTTLATTSEDGTRSASTTTEYTEEPKAQEPMANRGSIELSAGNLLEQTIQRTSNRLDRLGTMEQLDRTIVSSTASATYENSRPTTKSSLTYSENPIVTPTALAHTVWRKMLMSFNTPIAVIDATCGNGHDSVALAKMLLLQSSYDDDSELICVDIQETACEATRQSLRAILPDEQMDKQVRIIQSSHAPTLPRPIIAPAVGLVCYNLGWLPKSSAEEKSMYHTKMESTLQSLEDAVQLLCVGGILSVTTYPKTNLNEDYAAHAFLEALALISASSEQDAVAEFLQGLGPDPDNGSTTLVRKAVTATIERLLESCRNHVWRVTEQRQMGRELAPILLLATRIK